MDHQLITIPFHEDQIYMVEIDGEPYVPVKPIVDNLGIAWQPQHAKLDADKNRWGIIISRIPSPGGPQETICITLRKIPAFLYSIDARKVKESAQPKLRMYQDECDKVLWDYWTKGRAINHRGQVESEFDGFRIAVSLLQTICEECRIDFTQFGKLLWFRSIGLNQQEASKLTLIKQTQIARIEYELKALGITFRATKGVARRQAIRDNMVHLFKGTIGNVKIVEKKEIASGKGHKENMTIEGEEL